MYERIFYLGPLPFEIHFSAHSAALIFASLENLRLPVNRMGFFAALVVFFVDLDSFVSFGGDQTRSRVVECH